MIKPEQSTSTPWDHGICATRIAVVTDVEPLSTAAPDSGQHKSRLWLTQLHNCHSNIVTWLTVKPQSESDCGYGSWLLFTTCASDGRMLSVKITALFKLLLDISRVICKFHHVHDGRCPTGFSLMWQVAAHCGDARAAPHVRCKRNVSSLLLTVVSRSAYACVCDE